MSDEYKPTWRKTVGLILLIISMVFWVGVVSDWKAGLIHDDSATIAGALTLPVVFGLAGLFLLAKEWERMPPKNPPSAH